MSKAKPSIQCPHGKGFNCRQCYAKPSTFEADACTRCDGSGRYSRNSAGSRQCYKCGGRGWTLTKRGRAAQAYYQQQIAKLGRDLQPGDVLWFDCLTVRVKAPVAEVIAEPGGLLRVTATRASTGEALAMLCRPDAPVITAPGLQAMQAAVSAALAYQQTLNKTGLPAARVKP